MTSASTAVQRLDLVAVGAGETDQPAPQEEVESPLFGAQVPLPVRE